MNNENTENQSAETKTADDLQYGDTMTDEQDRDGWAELQTEDFQLTDEVAKQLDALIEPLFKFCEENQVPMVLLTVSAAQDGRARHNLAQSYANPKRASKFIGLVSKLIAHQGFLGDADDAKKWLDERIQEGFSKANPLELLLKQLGFAR